MKNLKRTKSKIKESKLFIFKKILGPRKNKKKLNQRDWKQKRKNMTGKF